MPQFASLAEYVGLGELLAGKPILGSSRAQFPSAGFRWTNYWPTPDTRQPVHIVSGSVRLDPRARCLPSVVNHDPDHRRDSNVDRDVLGARAPW